MEGPIVQLKPLYEHGVVRDDGGLPTLKDRGMESFWSAALKYGGSATVGAFVAYTIYPAIISSPILKNLNSSQLLALFCLIAFLTFIICILLINSVKSKPSGGNTITISKSKVHGDVTGGNRNSGKSE